MRRIVLIAFALVAFLAVGMLPERMRRPGAKPYAGTTIRAVVNAVYVKYSLSLVEKDLLDTLCIKIETEVIPLDAFVAKTLLEFNSGQSPWDLVMFGPLQHADLRAALRASRSVDPEAEARLLHGRHPLRVQEAHAAPQRQDRQHAVRRRHPHHVLEQDRLRAAHNKRKFKAKYGYDLAPPKTFKQWDDRPSSSTAGAGMAPTRSSSRRASYNPTCSGFSYHWWRARFLLLRRQRTSTST